MFNLIIHDDYYEWPFELIKFDPTNPGEVPSETFQWVEYLPKDAEEQRCWVRYVVRSKWLIDESKLHIEYRAKDQKHLPKGWPSAADDVFWVWGVHILTIEPGKNRGPSTWQYDKYSKPKDGPGWRLEETWDTMLDTFTLDPQAGTVKEPESDEHRKLKKYIAKNPDAIGLPGRSRKGETEYVFASADKADVVFKTPNGCVGVEVKSVISDDADLKRGLHQAVKYQALLRAEQKALLQPPTARAVLVSERQLPRSLQNLADVLGIKVHIVKVNR